MRSEGEARSLELVTDAVHTTDVQVASDETEASRRDAPDPMLTDDERAALEEAAESMRGGLTKVKLIGPDLGPSGWAGGARTPDGRIYFAPWSAPTVLCFDPATGESCHIGDFGGIYKYNQAVLGADGAIYFVPFSARRVLRLDPKTHEMKFIGSDYGSRFGKWGRGVLMSDGCVVAPPSSATKVLCIDTRAQSTSLIGSDYAREGFAKWSNAVLSPDGLVYCLPMDARQFLCIDAGSKATSLVGDDLGITAGKYISAAVVRGRLCCTPCNARRALIFDPADGSCRFIGKELFGREMYIGSIIGIDSCVYGIPLSARQVIRIDPEAETVQPFGPDGLTGGFDGVLVPESGFIYAAPANGSRMLRIDTRSATPPRGGTDDTPARRLLREFPAVWCLGLASKFSPDLCEYCARLTDTAPGRAIMEEFGANASDRDIERVAALPGVLNALVSIENKTTRDMMASSPILRRVLLARASVGGWIVEWLRDPAKMTLAIDYLELVNREIAVANEATGVVEAIAGVENFLPIMLKLPPQLMERAATLRIVVDLITSKVTLFQGAWVLLFVMLDFYLLLILLALLLDVTLQVRQSKNVPEAETVWLALSAIWFACRQASLARALWKLGLFKRWLAHVWNLVDVLLIVSVGIVVAATLPAAGVVGRFVARAGRAADVSASTSFVCVAAFAAGLAWVKLLGALRMLSVKCSLYVVTLLRILSDIRSFVAILFIIIATFASILHILFVGDHGWDENEEERPFRGIGGALLTLFRMAMGDFEMSWFEHPSEAISSVAVTLFVSFMVFFFLVCVNVLIAVVADSYDYALFRAHKIYLRTKLQLVAEFEAVGLTTLPLNGNGCFMDRILLPSLIAVFGNPLIAPFSMWWAEMLTNNPMRNDENQDAWDGRVRHFEMRVSEVVDHRLAQTERRVDEQIRALGTGMANEAQNVETRRQLAELRTEMTQMRTEASQTRLQIAELSSGVTQMRGQMDEMTVVLQGISAQAYLIRHRGTGSNTR